MQVPIRLPQTGATLTTSALSQSLSPGGMLIAEVQANDAAPGVSGWAQLIASGAVSGFEVFRWTTYGQEASVPLETRSPGSFLLVFDNTSGLTTGVALSNASATAATVTQNIYDDSGTLLQTSTLNIAPRSHSSYLLPGHDPATANKRGMVEYVVPTGSRIALIGLRAKADGTLTTVPVLARSEAP